MIAKLICGEKAAARLREMVGVAGEGEIEKAQIEFREVPYFLVSRSREQWTEARGDINAVRVENVTKLGLVIDPGGDESGKTRTVIPWANVISLTLSEG